MGVQWGYRSSVAKNEKSVSMVSNSRPGRVEGNLATKRKVRAEGSQGTSDGPNALMLPSKELPYGHSWWEKGAFTRHHAPPRLEIKEAL